MKIVLLDDSPTVRAAAADIMRTAGHDFVACQSWDELRACVEGELPDLVLLDVQMPLVSGAPIAVVLKKLYPKLRLVYYSSCDEEVLRKLTAETGADGYIQKDENPDRLLEKVASYLPQNDSPT